MAQQFPTITVDTRNPDPLWAINAFLFCMTKARSLGMCPPTEHVLAEHLFRKDARVVFYSSMAGVTSLVMDDEALDDLDDDDAFELMMSILRRRKERRRLKRAQADRSPQGEDPQGLHAEHESAVVSEASDAPDLHECVRKEGVSDE